MKRTLCSLLLAGLPFGNSLAEPPASPGDRYDVSANASQTTPARLLTVFVVDFVGR